MLELARMSIARTSAADAADGANTANATNSTNAANATPTPTAAAINSGP